jgi:hypothetical protein
LEVTFFAAVPLPAFPTAGDYLCYSIKFIFFIIAYFLDFVRPSGSGKSSVVKAGLLPALRKGAQPGSDQWFSIEMLPGPHPPEELETGLPRIAAQQPGGLMEQLRREPPAHRFCGLE